MPNFKIIQNLADDARVKIYGSRNIAILTNNEGNIVITAPAEGLAITAPSHGLLVTASTDGLAITAPSHGLLVTASTDGLAITAPSHGLLVTASTDGLAITAPANGLLITSPGLAVIAQQSTTDVTEVIANMTDVNGSGSHTYNVLAVDTFTFGLYNDSRTDKAQLTAKMQISPDALHWINDGDAVTLGIGEVGTLVPGIFLKYARVYYAAVNATSAITLNIFFQGQS